MTMRIAGGCVLMLLTVGCDKPAATQTGSSTPEPVAAVVLPDALFVASPPSEAIGVAAAKAKASVGETITVHGFIGGRKQTFVDGRAMFLIADPALKSCGGMDDDHCPTPWDYCCEDESKLVAGTMTIQIVDAAGRPLKLDVNGKHGLKPLAEVTIRGKVSQKPDEKSAVLDAEAIYIKS